MLKVCDTQPCRLSAKCAISKLNSPSPRVRNAKYLHYTAPLIGESCNGFIDINGDRHERKKNQG